MYKTYKRALGVVPKSSQGLYEERIVINGSDEPIGVVDKYGNKYTIKKDPSEQGKEIKIWVRSGIGNGTHDSMVPVTHETDICVIDPRILLTEMVYVKEADVVICNVKNLPYCEHPNQSFSYEDGMKWLYSEMLEQKNIKTPTVKIIANDPSGKIPWVYISILDTICKVEASHYQTADDGVTIIFPYDHFIMKHISFKQIIESDGYVKTDKVNVFIGLSPDIVRSALNREFAEHKVYSQLEMDQAKEEWRKRAESVQKSAEQALTQKHKATSASTDAEIIRLKTELESTKQELSVLRNVMTSSDGYLNMVSRHMSHNEKVMDSETKKLSMLVNVLKIIVPLIGGLMVGKMFAGGAAAAAGK